jgi:hypothetical protein
VERKVWTAGEFDRLTPAEHAALLDASVLTVLDQVPVPLLDRVRDRAEQRLVPGEPSRVLGGLPSGAAPT